jgi:hypothetical protein
MAHMSYSTLNVELTGYDTVIQPKDLQYHRMAVRQGLVSRGCKPD